MARTPARCYTYPVKHCTRHAKRRFLEYLGDPLPDAAWAEIVKNAREGVYRKRKPRRRPHRARGGRELRRRCPVYDVPIQGEVLLRVPMVINTLEGVVVTVLPISQWPAPGPGATP